MGIGDVSFYGLSPLIIYTISLCILVLLRSILRTNNSLHRHFGAFSTIFAAFGSMLIGAIRWRQFDVGLLDIKDEKTLNNLVNIDRIAALGTVVISLLVIIATLVACRYLEERHDIPAGEFFILLQVAVLGMCAMVMANDLIAMFVALEIFSIPLYVLTALDRRRLRSIEAGFKYFIIGAVSSAILLYGIALYYGASGTTQFFAVQETTTLSIISSLFISVGIFFKVAAIPFHFWSPDVYQGAPSPVTVFMSAATKLTAFLVLVRLVMLNVIDLQSSDSILRSAFTIVCVASALGGSILALRQSNIKRAMAYSSITHTSYILLAVKAGSMPALQSAVTYIVIYSFIIAGTFSIISVLSTSREQNDSISSLNGLHATHPFLAGSLAILLFAQTGIPLTSGFIAKFDVFRTVFASGFYVSGVIVLIATVISAAFYLRLVMRIYSENSLGDEKAISLQRELRASRGASIAIGFCVIVTISVGIFPTLVTSFTHAL